MIQGRKEAGYGITFDLTGRQVEVPHQQCVHCQAVFPLLSTEKDKTIVFEPGTKQWIKVDKGFCMRCMAVTCMRAECNKECHGPFRDDWA